MIDQTSAIAHATPTVVLVHGAFADGSSWSGVRRSLQTSGVAVIAPVNPLRGIVIDTGFLAAIIGDIHGSVLLVGHSYGGAVITNVVALVQNVIGLIYIAAYAPDVGESLAEIGGRVPPPDDALTAAAWKTLPSWYAVATADQTIHPDEQRFFAKRAGSITIEIDASHSIAASHAEAIASLILTAVRTVS